MGTRTQSARALLLACALMASVAHAGRNGIEARPDGFVLKQPLGDLYDSALVLTTPGKKTPRVVSVEELADVLKGYDVVFFGELHGHPGLHLQELKVLRAMHERDPRIILSLEQFERDVQPVLDDYLADRIGERSLMDRGRAWDNYPTAYRPLVAYARQHNLPVIAAEAPSWAISCIGQFGTGILEQFTPEERGWVAAELHPASAAYREKFAAFESGSPTHGGGGATSPEAQLKSERSLAAQSARDDTMAESIFLARQRHPGRRVLHLNGAFHSDGFLGTVEQLTLRDPALRVAVIAPLEAVDPHAPGFAASHRGDGTVLALVYPGPADFVPDEDQSDFVHSITARRKANPCKYSLPPT